MEALIMTVRRILHCITGIFDYNLFCLSFGNFKLVRYNNNHGGGELNYWNSTVFYAFYERNFFHLELK